LDIVIKKIQTKRLKKSVLKRDKGVSKQTYAELMIKLSTHPFEHVREFYWRNI